VRETSAGAADTLDPIWKALSDPSRRAILDFLRDRPRTTTEIVESLPHLTRFGVMKHLEVLRQAHLVQTREAGRQRVNSLNVVPIRQIYERWVGPFQELWSGELLQIKDLAESESMSGTAAIACQGKETLGRQKRPASHNSKSDKERR
jgi:DNA-binding transcriptional ArsR family regulator